MCCRSSRSAASCVSIDTFPRLPFRLPIASVVSKCGLRQGIRVCLSIAAVWVILNLGAVASWPEVQKSAEASWQWCAQLRQPEPGMTPYPKATQTWSLSSTLSQARRVLGLLPDFASRQGPGRAGAAVDRLAIALGHITKNGGPTLYELASYIKGPNPVTVS